MRYLWLSLPLLVLLGCTNTLKDLGRYELSKEFKVNMDNSASIYISSYMDSTEGTIQFDRKAEDFVTKSFNDLKGFMLAIAAGITAVIGVWGRIKAEAKLNKIGGQ